MISPAAYFSRHAQALLGALGRLVRQPLGTLFTVVVIALALALPAGLGLLAKNVQRAAGSLTEAVELTLYLELSVTVDQAERLAQRTRELPQVARVQFIPADQGLAQLREYSGLGAAIDALPDNPLPHVLVVQPMAEHSTVVELESLQKLFTGWPEVEIVQFDSQWVRRLAAILDLLQYLFLAIGALLAVGVIAIIAQAIRLEIGVRRAEIEVTQLVGGSNAFVRRPFLYTGLILGLLGGVLSILIVQGLLALLAPQVGRLSTLYSGQFALQGLTLAEMTNLVVIAATLGWLGAWAGAARQIARLRPRA
ncbi:MAG: permease-like cell division protein FtsX [Steroidobacteraceae bacterium]